MREQILTLLERNSRMTAEEIAVLLGSSREMVEEEIRKMEEQRIICGYNTLINWEQADADKVTGLIEVRVSPQRGKGFDHIAERIYNYPEVKSVYLISGGYDLLVILEGKSLKEIASFVHSKLSTMESVLSTATHFILKKYKDDGIIFNQEKADQRQSITP